MAIEDNKTNKRNNLLNASYELFTTIGFQNTTISKITTTANVGKGTFYLYFNNKDEIRHALIVEKSSHIIKNAIKIFLFIILFPQYGIFSLENSCLYTL